MADEVRHRRMLMLRRMESQPRRRRLEARRKPQAQRRPRVEQVPPVDRVEEADEELQRRLRQALAAPPRAVVSPTGLATVRSRRAS